jgi:uncharacterized Ntn-hydrolase superfamily protein
VTFSIVARGADGAFGVAVASKFLAVGAAVPAAQARVGAVATQAFVNLAYRPQALALLRTGVSAAGTVAALTAADEERDTRQVGVVAAAGAGASFTGARCTAWAGGTAGDGYAAQGNILTGPEVVAALEQAWLASDPEAPLARRLIAALAEGDAAGGDRRGRQSAALLVVAPGAGYGGGSDVLADLRSDDAARPIDELTRLLDRHELYFGRPDPASLLPLRGAVAAEVRDRLTRLGHRSADLEAALLDWLGVENYEERFVPGSIDPVVLARLREQPDRVTP